MGNVLGWCERQPASGWGSTQYLDQGLQGGAAEAIGYEGRFVQAQDVVGIPQGNVGSPLAQVKGVFKQVGFLRA